MSEGHHIIPAKVYTRTLVGLLFLTVITVAVTYVELGTPMNVILAMIIATVKASLVCLFFMGLKYDRPLNSLVFASSLIFLLCFFLFVFADLLTRGSLDPVKGIRDPLNDIKYEKTYEKPGFHNKKAAAAPAKKTEGDSSKQTDKPQKTEKEETPK